jgi:MFS family permease
MWAVYLPVLRNKRFLLLAAGQLTSQLGNFVGYIAVMALLYRLTGSSMVVGLYLGAQVVAGLVFGPLAGPLVDRMDKRRLMIASDLVRALLVLALPWAGAAWQVLAIAVAKAAVGALFQPAKVAMVPRVLGRDELNAGISFEQTAGNLVQVLGPALGGVVVGFFGVATGFALAAATFLLSALALLLLRVDAGTAEAEAGRPARQGWWSGYREVAANGPFLRLVASKAVVLVGCQAVTVVLLAYALDVLHSGHGGFGLISTCLGAGAVAGSLLHAPVSRRVKPGAVMAGAALLVGLSVGLASQAVVPALGFLLFVGAGVGIGAYNASFAVTFQRRVPEQHLGKAAAGSQLVDNLIILAALAGGGLLADLLGVRLVMLAAGAVVVLGGLTGLAVGRVAAPQPEQGREPEQAAAAAEGRPQVVRVRVAVSDYGPARQAAGARAAVDDGQNSISIGYDGN